MTRDVSTVSCVKRRGVEVLEKIRGSGSGDKGRRGSTMGRYTAGDKRGGEAGLEDDGDRRRWTVRESARRGFKVHALEGYTMGKTLRADRHRHRD